MFADFKIGADQRINVQVAFNDGDSIGRLTIKDGSTQLATGIHKIDAQRIVMALQLFLDAQAEEETPRELLSVVPNGDEFDLFDQ